jgi:hypothetical protein
MLLFPAQTPVYVDVPPLEKSKLRMLPELIDKEYDPAVMMKLKVLASIGDAGEIAVATAPE